MWNNLLTDNPLIVKHVRSKLRSPQSKYLVFMTVVVCCLLMWAGHEGKFFKDGAWFVLFVVGESVILSFFGMSQVSTALAQATDSGILDFHRISPLPPSRNALGFLFGAPIREYFVVAFILPFTLLCAILAIKPSVLAGFFSVHLVMISTTVLFHLIALTSGLIGGRSKSRGGNAVLIGVLAGFAMWPLTEVSVATPAFLSIQPAIAEALGWQQGDAMVPFFGLHLPYFLQSLIYQLPLIGFLFVPTIRRMRSADMMLYPKPIATAFLATVSVLNLGGLVGRESLQLELILPVLMYSNLVLACVLAISVTPDRGQFRNHLRRSLRLNMLRPSMTTDEASSRSVIWMFGLVTYGVAQAAAWLAPDQQKVGLEYLLSALTTISSIMTFGFALQWFRLSQPKSSTAATAVLLFVLWLLPLPIGAIFGIAGVQFAVAITNVSPLAGIVTRSPISFGVSAVTAVILWAVLSREESREWAEMQPQNKLIGDESIAI